MSRAVAFSVPHPTLGEDLAAAIVADDDAELDIAQLRRYAAERLAPHKVPQRIVVLDDIPLGPTGKVQRIGLAERLGLSVREGDGVDREQLTFASSMEAALAGVWCRVLELDAVGRDDRFVEIGGDSLSAVALVADVADVFGVDLPITAPLDEGATVVDMAAMVRTARVRPATERPADVEVPAADGTVACPTVISYTQERFWVLHQLDPGSSAYNIPWALRLSGSLDINALRAALTAMTARHDALRSVFPARQGRPTVLVQPPSEFPLDVSDLSAAADPESAAGGRGGVPGFVALRSRARTPGSWFADQDCRR